MSLQKIQAGLKAPKGQYNNFGNYKYRSCEDIVEAVKPVLEKYKASLTVSDSIVQVGDRIYVKATATIKFEKGDTESVDGYAREPLARKGMDESQITGAASSYARKYALNGLLAIDDTKDADTMDSAKGAAVTKINVKQAKELDELIDISGTDLTSFLKFFSGKAGYEIKSTADLPFDAFDPAKTMLNKKVNDNDNP